MPSPFPGMDPYLEGEEWVSFHAKFAVEIARQLSPKLRPRYVARAERQYVFDDPDPAPEVNVSASQQDWPSRPFPTYRLKVEDVAERTLVTAIEVLSPANKRGGRKDYLKKRRRILAGSTHLIEIDLTRRGRRVPMTDPLPPAPYFVFLSRVERRPVMDVWPLALPDRLPSVPVPLLPGDADVMLDLQQAFTTVYDVFSYDLEFDYARPPEAPLPPADAAWADAHLRAAGLRV